MVKKRVIMQKNSWNFWHAKNQRFVVVFDLDGTLVDSKQLYIDTIHSYLIEHYFIFPKSHVSKALGPKLEITLRNISRFSQDVLDELKKKINKEVAHKASHLKLCPYAKSELKKLNEKGCIIILLTNSAASFAVNALKTHKVLRYFNKLFYAENFSSKEDAIKAIAKKYKTKVSDITYVADKKSDVKIARNVGCKIVIVLACSWDKSKFRGERYIVKSLKDLVI